jgi:hypothetical protein
MNGPPFSAVLSNPRRAVFAAVVIVVLHLLPLAGHPPAKNPNELVRIELATALASWASVDIGEPSRVYGGSEDVSRRGDRILADKAPGLSLIAVPVVWLAGPLLPTEDGTDLPRYWPLRHLLTALLVALGTAALFLFMVPRIPDLRAAPWAPLALIAALGTPLWTYGTVFFGHAPAAVLVAVAWVLLLRPETGDDPARPLFVGGVAAGYAVGTEYPTALMVVVLFAALACRRPPARHLAIVLAGFALGLLPTLIYHQAAFGAPWLTGYSFKADPGFQEIHSTGVVGVAFPDVESLWGVLFGSSRGLFFYSPVLLLTPVGLWLMCRRRGWRDVAPLIAAIVVHLGFAAGFVDWQAGWCAAARHLVPAIPLLAVPTLVAIAASARKTWALLVTTALVTLSAMRGFLTLVITPFFPPEFANPLAQIVLPSVREGAMAPTLLGSAVGLPSAIVWPAAAILTASALVWALADLGGTKKFRIALAMVLVIGAQLAWWAALSPPPETGTESYRSQLLDGLGHTGSAARNNSPSDHSMR